MTAFEIRLLAYLGAGLAYTAFIAWAAVTLTNHHRDRLETAERLAQAAQVQAQQQKTIDDLKAQQAATAAAEQKYADLKNATGGISDQLSRSVSDYAALRRSIVSAASSTAALADAARASTQSDSELASLVRQATQACLGDSAELTGLQVWAAGTTSSP